MRVSPSNMNSIKPEALKRLSDKIFCSDNTHCFIDRDRILAALSEEDIGSEARFIHARTLACLLNRLPTPIDPDDVFLGRMNEGPVCENIASPSRRLFSLGHCSPDYSRLLRDGFSGELDLIRKVAAEKGDHKSLVYLQNAETVIAAVQAFAHRYADAAQQAGKTRAAAALRRIPFEPAYDLFSALQAIWLIHMIASCLVGSRDYAFGRLDETLLPYYEIEKRNGASDEDIVLMLRGFMVKCNEICGRTTHNHAIKPIHCHSSKQYVNIGGAHPNALSPLILRAAADNNLAQPQITVLLNSQADKRFTQCVFEALSHLTDKLHVYNYPMTVRYLLSLGLPHAVAEDYTYSACCTFDLNWRTIRRECYLPTVQCFIKALNGGSCTCIDELYQRYQSILRSEWAGYVQSVQNSLCESTDDNPDAEKLFVFDALLIGSSAERCRYPLDGGLEYVVLNAFLPGMATIGDSFAAIEKYVFEEKLFSYDAFIATVQSNFEGHASLRARILDDVKFGNDTDADQWTLRAANVSIDALLSVETPKNMFTVPGFYSLERDNTQASSLQATPDGRLAQSPYSENQSPSYGADKCGVTALLKSIAKLPFHRAPGGGLNLTFSHDVSAELLRALTLSYFELGGLHVGLSVVNRETLLDAMQCPDRYKSLTVRLYGFSEYFVSLPAWQQIAVLNRTEY